VVRQPGIQRDIGRERAGRIGHDDGVAIGERVRCLLDGDGAAGARPVVHDKALVEGACHFVEHDARNNVGDARGGERHHDLDGAVGIIRRGRCVRGKP
jgi:hypothetical protein